MTRTRKHRLPAMINVGHKPPSHRTARAQATVLLPPSVAAHIRDGDIVTRKGRVFPAAVIAGIMAAKRTSSLIPFCHPISLEDCAVEISLKGKREVRIECRVEAHDKTGVEMEALTGAAAAALTVYDMCKGYSQKIEITGIHLVEKKGGKSDYTR